jgi:hypothetical protein
MRSETIMTGDELRSAEAGALVYTVRDVQIQPPHVVAVVQFADGGDGKRMWEIGQEIPLMVRPVECEHDWRSSPFGDVCRKCQVRLPQPR